MLFRPAALAAVSLVSLTGMARGVVLYDGSLGTAPTTQTPSLLFFNIPGGASLTTGPTSATLNTTFNNGIYSGLSMISPVTLDPAVGYTVRVDAKILSSTFTKDSRAGFSIIAIGSDKRGVEIGFHTNEIYALKYTAVPSPDLVRDEVVSFDTTSAITKYELSVSGTTFTLRADGTSIMTGPTKDYAPFAGAIDPYETDNFLWFGDNTTSASGSTEFSRLEVIVPEPTTALSVGLLMSLLRRRK
jgi:hypothetical protein